LPLIDYFDTLSLSIFLRHFITIIFDISLSTLSPFSFIFELLAHFFFHSIFSAIRHISFRFHFHILLMPLLLMLIRLLMPMLDAIFRFSSLIISPYYCCHC